MATKTVEQLEQEIADLEKQHYGSDPAGQQDTPTESADAPPREGDTAEPQRETHTDEPDRGDQEKVAEEGEENPALLRERLKNAQARMTRATQETAEERRKVAALEARVAELESQGNDKAAAKAGTDDPEDEIKRLLEEYPDLVGPLHKRLSRVEARADEIHRTDEARRQEVAQEAHLSAIRDAHNDMDELVASEDFDGWLARQTPTWQAVARQGTAADVVELLDRYKSDMGINSAEPQRESAVDRARKVSEPTMPKARRPDPNAGRKVWTRAEIAALSDTEYAEREAEIDRAVTEGRVR